MFRTTRKILDHEIRLASLALTVAELREREQKATPAELFKLIEALQADIDTIRISLRSINGRLNYEKRRQTPAAGRADDDAIPSDEEFQRLLELQRAHGSSN